MLLQELLCYEGRSINLLCSVCKQNAGSIRCTTCFESPVFCSSCLLNSHRNLPFHDVEVWKDNHFAKSSLLEHGYVLHLGHGGNQCPSSDLFSSSTKMVIVHTSGIYQNRVQWCNCSDAPAHYIQLFRAGMFSASFKRPESAFTFDLLHYYHIDTLECKTSAMSFYQKLKRLTNNAFPDEVKTRYVELMRVSRQWRDLVNRKRFGYAYDATLSGQEGSLALFCPACPQPGINLEKDYKKKYPDWALQRIIVADGNFKGELLMPKNPDKDIALTSGEAYVTNQNKYAEHLRVAKEIKEKPSCHKHRAVSESNSQKRNLMATGIGACACARHGCFIPNTVVDFQLGERQMNMDYSICNALRFNSKGLVKAVSIYDIVCQWFRNFFLRLDQSSYLNIGHWAAEDLTFAIGKFHLHAHIKECFPRFSLNFVKGIGQVEGEILETLWASFNPIAGYARTMTKGHRGEIYDEHMRDWNWKKIVGIVSMLVRKQKNAQKESETTKKIYMDINARLHVDDIKRWSELEEKAMESRGEALDIYHLESSKAPSFAEVQLAWHKEKTKSEGSEIFQWIASAILLEMELEEVKYILQYEISRKRTPLQLAFYQKKDQLLTQIEDCNGEGILLLNLSKETEVETAIETSVENDEDDIEETDDEDEESINDEAIEEAKEHLPELNAITVLLPSNIKTKTNINEAKQFELELRKGQANDALEGLRDALGYKSLILATELRAASSTKQKTRTYNGVQKISKAVAKWARMYRKTRKAMINLNADKPTFEEYKELEQKDLQLNKDISEANRFFQKNYTLPWFWQLGKENANDSNTWRDDCKLFFSGWDIHNI